jgi:membrane-associated phospholipid phosphatase
MTAQGLLGYSAALALLLTLLPARGMSAQNVRARDSVQAVPVARRDVPLFRRTDLLAVAGLGVAVAVTMPRDLRIERDFQQPGTQSNQTLKVLLKNTGMLGDPGSVVLSAGLYFAGLGTHSRPLAALGMHTGEAVVLGGVIAELVKGEVGRARPKISPNDSRVYRRGKGFSSDDYGSFPSAETTAAFAAATALSREVGREWPVHSRLVSSLAYAGATLVAGSRLYNNEHWASDVVAGAGIGSFSAVVFDRYNQRYPNNVLERIFLPASIVRYRGLVHVEWSVAR